MNSTENWWRGEIDWHTPAGQILRKFLAALPPQGSFSISLYGSAPLQLTIDPTLLSGDIDIFSNKDDDLTHFIREQGLDKAHAGLHIEAGFELSFRTSPRWRLRARTIQLANVSLTIPHPIDVLIGKLDRLAPKDLTAFKRVIALTGHPTAEEMIRELQNSVDLFRPGFDEESPGRFRANAESLWREVFGREIDVQREIIAPAIQRRRQGYGEEPPDYKGVLKDA
jgi:hypothetical protein